MAKRNKTTGNATLFFLCILLLIVSVLSLSTRLGQTSFATSAGQIKLAIFRATPSSGSSGAGVGAGAEVGENPAEIESPLVTTKEWTLSKEIGQIDDEKIIPLKENEIVTFRVKPYENNLETYEHSVGVLEIGNSFVRLLISSNLPTEIILYVGEVKEVVLDDGNGAISIISVKLNSIYNGVADIVIKQIDKQESVFKIALPKVYGSIYLDIILVASIIVLLVIIKLIIKKDWRKYINKLILN